MNFRKMLCADHLGADDFLDASMEPIERTLTIKAVRLAKPPAGKKDRPMFAFAETEKTAFLANKEVKTIAHQLRRSDTDQWIGAKLTITSVAKIMAGAPTTGMKVVRAFFAKPSAAAAEQTAAILEPANV